MQYYGRFYPSALYPLLARVNAYLVRWIRNQYRRYDATRAARRKLTEIVGRSGVLRAVRAVLRPAAGPPLHTDGAVYLRLVLRGTRGASTSPGVGHFGLRLRRPRQ
jgi:hypothetical protein